MNIPESENTTEYEQSSLLFTPPPQRPVILCQNPEIITINTSPYSDELHAFASLRLVSPKKGYSEKVLNVTAAKKTRNSCHNSIRSNVKTIVKPFETKNVIYEDMSLEDLKVKYCCNKKKAA